MIGRKRSRSTTGTRETSEADDQGKPTEAPKRKRRTENTRSKATSPLPTTGLARTSESDSEAVDSPEPAPKRRRLHGCKGSAHAHSEDDSYHSSESEHEGLKPEELRDIADKRKGARGLNTNHAYKCADKKIQWYCEHHGGEDPLLDAGLPHEHPLDGVLFGVNGHALAVRYMRWSATLLDYAPYQAVYDTVTKIKLSDDGRLVFQPDFLPPSQIIAIGPCPAMVLAATIRGGKAQKNGKPGYGGCLRNKDVLRCSLPRPQKKEAWNKEVPAFPAKHGAKENLSFEQQATSMWKYLNHLKIYIKKLTHAWWVMCRMGGWLYDAMYKSYLEFFKASGLMGAAGWEGAATNELRMFFAERFFIVVPAELQNLVFPFLP
ncbi:TPA: hypothetical protein ACH3X1_002643 [Trebouxia sp. C0004]